MAYYGTPSGIAKPGDLLAPTGKLSDKTFRVPTGWHSRANDLRHLKYDLRQPTRGMHMVPDATLTPLIRNGEITEAVFTILCNDRRAALFNLERKIGEKNNSSHTTCSQRMAML